MDGLPQLTRLKAPTELVKKDPNEKVVISLAPQTTEEKDTKKRLISFWSLEELPEEDENDYEESDDDITDKESDVKREPVSPPQPLLVIDFSIITLSCMSIIPS